MTTTKMSDWADQFYPGEPEELATLIDRLLDDAHQFGDIPLGLIIPHAGYVYSGAVAATAYKTLSNIENFNQTICILSPAHRLPLTGIALTSYGQFETPLGNVSVDTKRNSELTKHPFAQIEDRAFIQEHAIEVHLPFIKKVAPNACIIPIVVGNTPAADIADLIEDLYENNVFIIVSSDLSHFLNYQEAQRVDTNTKKIIENLDYDLLKPELACGFFPLRGLLQFADRHKMKASCLDLRNSSDVANAAKDSVVGHGSFLIKKT